MISSTVFPVTSASYLEPSSAVTNGKDALFDDDKRVLQCNMLLPADIIGCLFAKNEHAPIAASAIVYTWKRCMHMKNITYVSFQKMSRKEQHIQRVETSSLISTHKHKM